MPSKTDMTAVLIGKGHIVWKDSMKALSYFVIKDVEYQSRLLRGEKIALSPLH